MIQSLTTITTVIVAIEAFIIMFIEMFANTSKVAQKAFDLPLSYLKQHEAKISMANQGLYNGFIGLGILASLFIFPNNATPYGLFLFVMFVIIAAIFGAMTVNKKIILTQGLPAIVALICLFINYII
ncbi:DUF1304 domain-containing protein [Holzapfeliella sp. JNUCC 80]